MPSVKTAVRDRFSGSLGDKNIEAIERAYKGVISE
jgi:Pyruvate/2-oxoacid:ferredoxin oxidoreductase gamma subunit